MERKMYVNLEALYKDYIEDLYRSAYKALDLIIAKGDPVLHGHKKATIMHGGHRMWVKEVYYYTGEDGGIHLGLSFSNDDETCGKIVKDRDIENMRDYFYIVDYLVSLHPHLFEKI